MDSTAYFYSRPSYATGAGAIFSGARRQRGGSIFGALKSIVAPLLSGVGRSLKRNVIRNAVGLANDVVTDVSSGKNIKTSLMTRGKQRGLNMLKQTLGNVTRRAPKRTRGRRKNQKGAGRKHSRKRRASRKNVPRAKKRRRNY